MGEYTIYIYLNMDIFYDAVYTLLLLFWMIYEMCSYDTALFVSNSIGVDMVTHDIEMVVYSVESWRKA